jgi:hypothetical protein
MLHATCFMAPAGGREMRHFMALLAAAPQEKNEKAQGTKDLGSEPRLFKTTLNKFFGSD